MPRRRALLLAALQQRYVLPEVGNRAAEVIDLSLAGLFVPDVGN